MQSVFERVEFKQANLANPASVERAFQCEGGEHFNYVINLAAETKYGQSDEVRCV
jgi:dTDP-D-glucose 4,6-dehydratase